MAAPLFGFTSRGASASEINIPSDIAGLTLWLDSSELFYFSRSGSNVLSWTDKTSLRLFTPSVGGTYPIRATNTSGVNFPNAGSGTGPYGLTYSTTWYLPTQNASIFIVHQPTQSSSYNSSLGLTSVSNTTRPNLYILTQMGTSEKTNTRIDWTGSAFSLEVESANNGGISIGELRLDEIIQTNSSSTTKILTNGIENTYANGPDSYTSPYTNYPVVYTSLGGNTTAFGARSFTGNIHEIAIYTRAVTPSERVNLENYFYLKWRFAPTQISSNVYWFDAADTSTITVSGKTLTSWSNKGSSSMIYYSNTGTVTTGVINKNGKNIISFPTSSKLVSGNTNLGITGNDETIFVVYQKRGNFSLNSGITLMGANNPDPGGNPNGYYLYYQGINNGNDIQTNTSNYDNFWVVSGGFCFPASGNTPTYSPYTYQLLSLSVSQTSPGFWSFGGNNNGVGGGPGQRYEGCAPGYTTATMTFNMGISTADWDIAEYIVYNRVLTTTERQRVEGYLSIKWEIPLVSSHPYYNIPSSNAFTPTTIGGTILWLDAADTGAFTGGTTWTDKSGTNNHGINGTPGTSAMPTTTTWSNGRRAARFVTASKNSVKTTNTIPNYVTYFIVARIQAAVGYGFFMINDYDGQRQMPMNTSSFPAEVFFYTGGTIMSIGSFIQGQGFVFSGTVTSGSSFAYGNGIQTGSNAAVSPSGSSQNYFGSANGDAGYLTIDIGEIIIYNSILSLENRQKVEAYLANKWGIVMHTNTFGTIHIFTGITSYTGIINVNNSSQNNTSLGPLYSYQVGYMRGNLKVLGSSGTLFYDYVFSNAEAGSPYLIAYYYTGENQTGTSTQFINTSLDYNSGSVTLPIGTSSYSFEYSAYQNDTGNGWEMYLNSTIS